MLNVRWLLVLGVVGCVESEGIAPQGSRPVAAETTDPEGPPAAPAAEPEADADCVGEEEHVDVAGGEDDSGRGHEEENEMPAADADADVDASKPPVAEDANTEESEGESESEGGGDNTPAEDSLGETANAIDAEQDTCAECNGTTGPESGCIPVHLENSLSFARAAEPVTTGIPFPQGVLREDTPLSLEHAASGVACVAGPVAAQLTPLIHWGDGSIKWLQADFQADVAANAPGYATGDARYFLKWGDAVESVAEDSGIVLAETNTTITVDTGPMQFTVRKDRFNLLDTVTVDGVVIVPQRDTNGLPTAWVKSRPHYRGSDGNIGWAGGDVLWDAANDSNYSAAVEFAGAMHTILTLRGWHRTGPGLGRNFDANGEHDGAFPYTIRLHAYAGSRDLRIEHTFVNSRFPEREAIRGIALRIPLNVAGEARATLGGESAASDVEVTLDANATAAVLQQAVESVPTARFAKGVPVDRYTHHVEYPNLLSNGGFEKFTGSNPAAWILDGNASVLGRTPNLVDDSGFDNGKWHGTRVAGAGRYGTTAALVGGRNGPACNYMMQTTRTGATPFTMKQGYRYITRGYWKRIGGHLFHPNTGNPTSEYLAPLRRELSNDTFTPMELFQGPLDRDYTLGADNPRILIQMIGNSGCLCSNSDYYTDSFYLDDFQILELAPEVRAGFGAALLGVDSTLTAADAIPVIPAVTYDLNAAFRCASGSTVCSADLAVDWVNAYGTIVESTIVPVAAKRDAWSVASLALRSPGSARTAAIRIAASAGAIAVDDVSFQRATASLRSTTGRSALYAAVGGISGGAAIVLRDGAYLYPKKLAAARDGLSVHFWPDDAEVPLLDLRRTEVRRDEEWEAYVASGQCAADAAEYVFRENRCDLRQGDPNAMPGVGRTHEIVVRFFSGAKPDSTALRQLSSAVDAPLLGFVSPAWNACSDVLGKIAPVDMENYFDEELVLESYAQWLHEHQRKWSLEPTTFMGKQYRHAWQGMMYFGGVQTLLIGSPADPRWGHYAGRHGWLNNEHEPAHFLFMNYLRTGKRLYFDLARGLAAHYADASVQHYAELGASGQVLNGAGSCAERFVTSNSQQLVGHGYRHWIDPWVGDPGSFIHTYALGVRDLYALTGARRMADVAVEFGEAMITDKATFLASSPVKSRGAAGLWRAIFPVYDMAQFTHGQKQANRYWTELVMPYTAEFLNDAAIAEDVSYLANDIVNDEWFLGNYSAWGYLEATQAMDPSDANQSYWAVQAAKAYGAYAQTTLHEDGERYRWQRPKNQLLWATGYRFTGDKRLLMPGEDDWADMVELARDPTLALESTISDTIAACRSGRCTFGKRVHKDTREIPMTWSKWPYWVQAWHDAGGRRDLPLNRVENSDFESADAVWAYIEGAVVQDLSSALEVGSGVEASNAVRLSTGTAIAQDWIPVLGGRSYKVTLQLSRAGDRSSTVRVRPQWYAPEKSGATVLDTYVLTQDPSLDEHDVPVAVDHYEAYEIQLTAPIGATATTHVRLVLETVFGEVLVDDVAFRLIAPER